MSSAVQKNLKNFLYSLIFFVSQLIYEVISFSMIQICISNTLLMIFMLSLIIQVK